MDWLKLMNFRWFFTDLLGVKRGGSLSVFSRESWWRASIRTIDGACFKSDLAHSYL